MKARYQFRFYPTNQQQQDLARLFGCVRVVWNDALAICKNGSKNPKSGDLQKQVINQAQRTDERAWLSEVSALPLQQSVADLGVAFKNFFESCTGKRKGPKVGYPRFKKRTNSQSARLTRGGFKIKGDEVYLAKIGTVSPIWSRQLPSTPSSVSIIKDCANRYFLSFVVAVEPIRTVAENQSTGIDLGLTTFAVMSNGTQATSPDYSKLERKLRKTRKKLARQQKGSVRRERTRLKIAKLHNRIADKRKNCRHKLSTQLVRENQAMTLEDLNVSGTIENRKLARAISQQGWAEFRALCEAKSEKSGRNFCVISRWEPTRQIGSDFGVRWGSEKCGLGGNAVLGEMQSWGTWQNRDENAAKNIEKVGMGYRHDSKWTMSDRKTTSVARCCEASRITAPLDAVSISNYF